MVRKWNCLIISYQWWCSLSFSLCHYHSFRGVPIGGEKQKPLFFSFKQNTHRRRSHCAHSQTHTHTHLWPLITKTSGGAPLGGWIGRTKRGEQRVSVLWVPSLRTLHRSHRKRGLRKASISSSSTLSLSLSLSLVIVVLVSRNGRKEEVEETTTQSSGQNMIREQVKLRRADDRLLESRETDRKRLCAFLWCREGKGLLANNTHR